MTPLPEVLAGPGADRSLIAWRLERETHADDWSQAEGAFRVGGRWSSPGRRVLYTALDPATAILEVAVHKGFDALDRLPHALLALRIDPDAVRIVQPGEIPNPHWLRPGVVSRNQQAFGDALLEAHPLVVIPSVVSTHSWNLLISAAAVEGPVALHARERFALDPRLAAGAS